MTQTEALSGPLAAQARQVFVRQVIDGLPQVAERLLDRLQAQLEQTRYSEETRRIDDARVRLLRHAPAWLEQARGRMAELLKPLRPAALSSQAAALSLVAEEAVENQILAARAALVAVDKGSEVLNPLRLRLQHLELTDELDKRDPVLALNVMQAVVDAWMAAGLTRDDWSVVQDDLNGLLAKVVTAGHQEANQFLLSRGVLPEIDLRELLRRSVRAAPEPVAAGAVALPAAVAAMAGAGSGRLTHVRPWRPTGETTVPGALGVAMAAEASGPQVVAQRLTDFLSTRVPGWAAPSSALLSGQAMGGALSGAAPAAAPGAGWWRDVPMPVVEVSTVEAGAAAAQAQARALKQAARSDAEKAVIELVALIFDGILGEDRIPASVRVWFARLQMPVLRHALQDASFLTSEDHPARVLIDRMGGCVLGFDPSVPPRALEAEIKRIVQVIEQYPETGRRVYEMMLRELEQFLEGAVTQEPRLKRAADLATQLEQRGALTVQYTIELRRLLGTAPVHEGLRTFLFQVWVEVMAQSAVAYGAQDGRAMRLRQLAADLLWAASAKATRHERAEVIARVPGLMAQLKEGLALIGRDAVAQERAVQPVSEALAAAFVSRTPAIDADWIASFARDLGRLETVWADSDDPVPLDRDSLEVLLERDASDLTVLPDAEAPVPAHLLAWAAALPLGAWFTLEHHGAKVVVQLAWLSPRRQLYLWATGSRQAFLLQRGRVAKSLKSGVLRAAQAEPLTRQATRQALDQLQAHPERLLA